jgi:sulfhydrogenase subunit delta
MAKEKNKISIVKKKKVAKKISVVKKEKNQKGKEKLKRKSGKVENPEDEVKIKVKNLVPKVAIIGLTSCEGCQFVILDLGQRFLDLTKKIEIVDFRLIEDEEDPGTDLDIIFVEGNPTTKDNLRTLFRARKRAKLLVALGNCAAMGGIPEIKNYQEGMNTIKHVYKYIRGISNPPIKEIDNFVKVDFVIPGCPINGEEFLKFVPLLLAGKIPMILDQPVCLECQKKGNRCLLLDKKPCFGPMILGGCDAVCPTSRMMCQGCRGLRPSGNISSMRQTLRAVMSEEEFENTTEIYGLRDDIEDREKKEKIGNKIRKHGN